MLSFANATSYPPVRRAPVLLMDWDVVGITPPGAPAPVPEMPTPIPPEFPQPLEPLGAPPPTESPIPVREPPVTLPPQY